MFTIHFQVHFPLISVRVKYFLVAFIKEGKFSDMPYDLAFSKSDHIWEPMNILQGNINTPTMT